MFSKIFSSLSSPKDVDEDIKNNINNVLNEYHSKVFPAGIMTNCSKQQIFQDKAGINVVLTLPFPCVSELNLLSDKLTQQFNLPINLVLDLAVEAVRCHDIGAIKNIIAISSGKGGVGKSTTAVNLAYALQAEGAKVGILDADIYGPSVPTLLGLQDQRPTSSDGKLITPLEKDGIIAMSIGFLVDNNDATIWRGPMASRAFSQLLNETDWPALDYLIVDMPPGTGDIQLTLSQSVPVAAAVVVTTPQDIALIDAIKGIAMFEKVSVPVLGVIENMSYHVCESCGHQSSLFGEGGGEDIANEFATKLLGKLPLDIKIRQHADQGHSIIENNQTMNAQEHEVSNGNISNIYRALANNIASALFTQLDMRSEQTADIVVTTD